MPIKLLIIFMLFYKSLDLSGASLRSIPGDGKYAKNLIYAEALGAGGYGSINYERLLFDREVLRLGIRGGFGTYNIYDYREKFNPDLIFPFALHILIFAPHTIEVGAGNTFSSIVKTNTDNLKAERDQRISANFVVGYRYSRKEGGIIIRVGYTPIIEFYDRYIHGGGISVGYAF